jgi:hypothetical protein
MDEPFLKPEVLFDSMLAGTPLRGLILQGPFCICAYLGVPQDHWIADMPSLEFDCHWGVTFNGDGGSSLRPAGWYWYGWDYGHAGDMLPSLAALPDNLAIPEELLEAFQTMLGGRSAPITLAEVEQDLIDAALSLNETLNATMAQAQAGIEQGRTRPVEKLTARTERASDTAAPVINLGAPSSSKEEARIPQSGPDSGNSPSVG